MKDVLGRWQQFWFAPIPPHVYALLRITFGVLGCVILVGLSDVSTFWNLDGFVPIGQSGIGLKTFLLGHGLGSMAGVVLYACTFASFLSMTVGFFSSVSVALALMSSLVQVSWNYLPLSGADAAMKAVLFCLLFADCGSVWSLDAWIAGRRGRIMESDPTYPIAPLRLIRFQVALIYLNAGLWKLFNPYWRDGSAVHYVLQSNAYRRLPQTLPVGLDHPWVSVLTYATLLWELSFAFLIPFARTRRVVLLAGVLLHLGMLLTIEIGPFHFVMLGSYLAFLDPHWVPELPRRISPRLWHPRTDVTRIETVTGR